MQINNRIADSHDDAVAWYPDLPEKQEPGFEKPSRFDITETRFADWGIGVVADLKFGPPGRAIGHHVALVGKGRPHDDSSWSVASPSTMPPSPPTMPPSPPTVPSSPPTKPPSPPTVPSSPPTMPPSPPTVPMSPPTLPPSPPTKPPSPPTMPPQSPPVTSKS